MPNESVELIADLKLQKPTTAERQIRDIERNLFKGAGRAGEPLGRLTGKVSEFDKSLEAANARVLAFGASAGVIAGITTAMRLMVEQTIKVEKTLLDINVLFGQSSESLSKFSDSLFEVAKNTGQSFFDVAEAAKEFSRQGLGVEETLSRTSDAMILARLTGLDLTKSVEQLTASVNQFSKEGLTTADVINRLANVDAKFAVSAKDLSEGLSRAGSVAQDAGASFNELIALITAVQQRTARGGAVIGNALKTIFTRTQRSDTLDSLEQLGIGVRDLQGNTVPVIQILSELSQKYDKLGSSQQAFVSELVGGGYQINVVKSLFDDLGRTVPEYAKALNTASQSTDEAYQRNELLNKSLSSLANEAGQNITKVAASFGKLTFGPALKNVFGIVNNLSDQIDGQGVGEKIGTGILTGIGDFLGGPGLVYLTALAGKLFTKFGSFAKDSIGEVLSLGAPNAKVLDTQKGIVELLNQDINARAIIENKATSLVQKEQQLIALIRERVALDASANAAQIGLARNIVSQGVQYKPSLGTFKVKAGGHMPLSMSQIPQEAVMKEIVGAKQAGYNIQPSDVRAMRATIDGKQTTVVYNNKEKIIHDYMGSGEPAIIPPTGKVANYAGGKIVSRKIPQDKIISGIEAAQIGKRVLSEQLGLSKDQIADIVFSNQKSSDFGKYDPNTNKIKIFPRELIRKARAIQRGDQQLANVPLESIYQNLLGSAVLHEQFHNAYEFNKSGSRSLVKGLGGVVPDSTKKALAFLKKTAYKNPEKTYKSYAIEEAQAVQFGGLFGFPQYADGRMPKYKNFGKGGKFTRDSFGGFEFDHPLGGGLIDVDGNEASIAAFDTKKTGKGYSREVYKDMLDGLKKRGIKKVSGFLIPQDAAPRDNSPKSQLLARYPQLIRSRIGKSSVIQGENGELKISNRDLDENPSKILSFANRNRDLDLITNLSGGYINAAIGVNLEGKSARELKEVAKLYGIPYRPKADANELREMIRGSAIWKRVNRQEAKATERMGGSLVAAQEAGSLNTPRGFSRINFISGENAAETYTPLTPEQRALKNRLEGRVNASSPSISSSSQSGLNEYLRRKEAESPSVSRAVNLTREEIARREAGAQVSLANATSPQSSLDEYLRRKDLENPSVSRLTNLTAEEIRKSKSDALLKDIAQRRRSSLVGPVSVLGDVRGRYPSSTYRQVADSERKDLDYYKRVGAIKPTLNDTFSSVKSLALRANTRFENALGFGGTELQKLQSREKFSQRAFVASFAAPLVGGLAEQAFGSNDTTDQRRNRSIRGVASSIGTGAALGASVGGPWGAAIGVAIGLFGSLNSIIDNLNPSLEDLTEKVKKDSEERDKGIAALSNYSRTIDELVSNPSLSKEQRSSLEKIASRQISELSPEEKRKLRESSDKTKTVQELLSARQSQKDVSQSALSIPALLKTMKEDNYKKAGPNSNSFLSEFLNSSSQDLSNINLTDLSYSLKSSKDLRSSFDISGLKTGIKDIGEVTSKLGIPKEVIDSISKESADFQSTFVNNILNNLEDEISSRTVVSKESVQTVNFNKKLKEIRDSIAETLIKDISNFERASEDYTNQASIKKARKDSQFERRSSFLDFASPQLSNRAVVSYKTQLEIDKLNAEAFANISDINQNAKKQKFASIADIKTFAGGAAEGLPKNGSDELLTYLRDISQINPSDINASADAMLNLEKIVNTLKSNGDGAGPEAASLLERANQLYAQQLQKLSDIDESAKKQRDTLAEQLDIARKSAQDRAASDVARAGYLRLMENFSPSKALRGQLSFEEISAAAKERVSSSIFNADKNRAANESFAIRYSSGAVKSQLLESIRARNLRSSQIQGRGIEQSFETGGILNADYVSNLSDQNLKKSLMAQRAQKTGLLAGFYEASGAKAIRDQYSAEASPFLQQLQAGKYNNGSVINSGVSEGLASQLQAGNFSQVISRLQKIAPTLNQQGRSEASSVIASLQSGQIQLQANKTRAETEAKIKAGGAEVPKFFLQGLSKEAADAITGANNVSEQKAPVNNSVSVTVQGDASKETAQAVAKATLDALEYKVNVLIDKTGAVIPPKAVA